MMQHILAEGIQTSIRLMDSALTIQTLLLLDQSSVIVKLQMAEQLNTVIMRATLASGEELVGRLLDFLVSQTYTDIIDSDSVIGCGPSLTEHF